MPATNTYSAKAPEMGQSSTSLNEPSMEDILASIRRIIAEDQSNNLGRSSLSGLARRAAPTAPAPEKVAADPVALQAATEAPVQADVLAPVPPIPAAEPLAAAPPVAAFHHTDVLAAEPAPIPLRPSHVAADVTHAAPVQGELQAAELDDAPAAFEEAHDIDESVESETFAWGVPDHQEPADDQGPLISSAAGASITSSFQTLADTVLIQDPGLIERIMRETLRPMLKTWLDDHLPSVVERLVRAEIERVARGGRSRD